MKESKKQVLDWVFFSISIVAIVVGIIMTVASNMIGVWLIAISAYAAYSSYNPGKIGKGSGIFFVVLGASSFIWCIVYAVHLFTLAPVIRDWTAGLGWLLFGMMCLPMGIYFIRRAKGVKVS